jgi:hypothetical protein
LKSIESRSRQCLRQWYRGSKIRLGREILEAEKAGWEVVRWLQRWDNVVLNYQGCQWEWEGWKRAEKSWEGSVSLAETAN